MTILAMFISSRRAFKSDDVFNSSFLAILIGRLADFPDYVTWILTDMRASELPISLTT